MFSTLQAQRKPLSGKAIFPTKKIDGISGNALSIPDWSWQISPQT